MRLPEKFVHPERRANGVMLETETRHLFVGVLRNSSMIAVLPEIAFIDSPLSNPDINVLRNRRQEVAHILAESISQFFGVDLQNNNDDEVDEMRYNTIREIEQAHEWAVPTIQKLIKKGFLQGGGNNNLDLSRFA